MDHSGMDHGHMDHGGMDMGGDQCSMNVGKLLRDDAEAKLTIPTRCYSPGLLRTFVSSFDSGVSHRRSVW